MARRHPKSKQFSVTNVILTLLFLTACNTTPAPFPVDKTGSTFEFFVDPVNATVTFSGAERDALQPQNLPSETRILEPGVDIDVRDFSFEFDPANNRLILRTRFKNVSEDKDFLQPFFFTLRGEESGSFKRATAPLVTDLQLGGDGVLSPGERTHKLTFVIVHLDQPFSFFIDVNAVVIGETPQVWPNAQSSANSDEWLVEHHDEIRKLEPRVLVLNFSNDTSYASVVAQTDQMIRALADSSRWHGYAVPDAPAFLEYQVAKIVDLRDPVPTESCDGNSSKYPRKASSGFNFDYAKLYNDTFAEYYAYPDPDTPGRYLGVAELVERGTVHEIWFFANHGDCGAPFETIELKQYYDEAFNKAGYGPAGNGHDYGMPWIGHSLRISFFNAHRGIGCGMENFGHALEGMRNYNAIPYYSRYFTDYADFNLNERYGLPFDSFYWYRGADINNLQPGDDQNVFPDPNTLDARFDGKVLTVPNYVAHGGSVHFPPNARQHYDYKSPYTVMSTIKSWRMGNGPGGDDLTEPFTSDVFEPYSDLAPDCMGPWLVYWRQNMPGLDNLARDDNGQPMKNWWPFLFY